MRYLICLLYFSLVACTSGAGRVPDQNRSLIDIKKVIVSVIGEPRSIVNEQRVYLSQYYGRKTDKNFDPLKSKIRQYTRISISGDRRPYDVDVDVIVEQRNGRVYEEIGTDDREAIAIAKEIKEKLHQGLEDRNVIDDFRVF